MRLTRQDMAKEFSLIVQQEIKNHNDVVLSSHASIEEFKRKINQISNELEKKLLLSSKSCSENHQAIKALDKIMEDAIAEFTRKLNDSNALMLSNFNGIKKSIEARESYFLTLDGFREFESKIDQWVSHLKISFHSQKQYLLDEINSLSKSIAQEIDKCRQEIDSKINLCKQEVKEINKSLDVFAVNYSGVLSEIERCKKRCFVIEKNIENIYIQIKRNNMGAS